MTEELPEEKQKKEPKPITPTQATELLRDGDKHGKYCFFTFKKLDNILKLTKAERVTFGEDPQAFGVKKTLAGSEPLYGFLTEDLEAVRGNMDPARRTTEVKDITLDGHVSSARRPLNNLRVR